MLADMKTKLVSKGEICVWFTRDKWRVIYRALVMESLAANAYGGTTFMWDNDVSFRIRKREITVLGKHRVYQTNTQACPPQPLNANITTSPLNNTITLPNKQVLLPGQQMHVRLPPILAETEKVAIEPRLENLDQNWPAPQICNVINEHISILNTTNEPIIIGKDVHIIGATIVEDMDINDPSFYMHEVNLERQEFRDPKYYLNQVRIN